MKKLIFLMVHLRYSLSPAEYLAFNEKIVEEYSFRIYVRSGVSNMEIRLSMADIIRNVRVRYQNGRLDMFLLLETPGSLVLDEWHVGSFTKSGKFIEAS